MKVKIETIKYAGIYSASTAQMSYLQSLMQKRGLEREFVMNIGKLDNEKNRFHITTSAASKLITALLNNKEVVFVNGYEPPPVLKEGELKIVYKPTPVKVDVPRKTFEEIQDQHYE